MGSYGDFCVGAEIVWESWIDIIDGLGKPLDDRTNYCFEGEKALRIAGVPGRTTLWES